MVSKSIVSAREEKIMALIKCPECGKEISEYADSCPNCGYSIKDYFEKKKQEKKQKELEKEREERKKQEEEKERLQDEKKKQIYNKLLGTRKKKIIFSLICFIALMSVAGISMWYYKSKENLRDIKKTIPECLERLDSVEEDLYEYFEFGEDRYYELDGLSLDMLEFSISKAREKYIKLNDNEKASLNSYMNNQFKMNWNELDERCNELGLTALNQDEYYDHMLGDEDYYTKIRNRLYAEHEEEQGEVVVENKEMDYSNGNYLISGTVKNTTNSTVYFVKVKVSILDKNGNVLNTDSTYAVGDEGLAPGESSTFKCYIDKVEGTEKYNAKVYDYSY